MYDLNNLPDKSKEDWAGLSYKNIVNYSKLLIMGACKLEDIPILYQWAVADYLEIPRLED